MKVSWGIIELALEYVRVCRTTGFAALYLTPEQFCEVPTEVYYFWSPYCTPDAKAATHEIVTTHRRTFCIRFVRTGWLSEQMTAIEFSQFLRTAAKLRRLENTHSPAPTERAPA